MTVVLEQPAMDIASDRQNKRFIFLSSATLGRRRLTSAVLEIRPPQIGVIGKTPPAEYEGDHNQRQRQHHHVAANSLQQLLLSAKDHAEKFLCDISTHQELNLVEGIERPADKDGVVTPRLGGPQTDSEDEKQQSVNQVIGQGGGTAAKLAKQRNQLRYADNFEQRRQCEQHRGGAEGEVSFVTRRFFHGGFLLCSLIQHATSDGRSTAVRFRRQPWRRRHRADFSQAPQVSHL